MKSLYIKPDPESRAFVFEKVRSPPGFVESLRGQRFKGLGV